MKGCMIMVLSDLVGSRMMNFLQPPPVYNSFNTETQDSHKVQNQVFMFDLKY